ncbi:MAG: IS110 family transposase [bacterium]|nr:IS110 family transposase [bacterium]
MIWISLFRVSMCVVDEVGSVVEQTEAHNSLRGMTDLAWQIARHGDGIRAVVESMNGAPFVHDTLDELGWDVEVADAARVEGFGPAATKTDRIDAWVLAELSRRDLVPAIWLPSPGARAGRNPRRTTTADPEPQTLPNPWGGPTYLGFLGLPRAISTTLNLYLRVNLGRGQTRYRRAIRRCRPSRCSCDPNRAVSPPPGRPAVGGQHVAPLQRPCQKSLPRRHPRSPSVDGSS